MRTLLKPYVKDAKYLFFLGSNQLLELAVLKVIFYFQSNLLIALTRKSWFKFEVR